MKEFSEFNDYTFLDNSRVTRKSGQMAKTKNTENILKQWKKERTRYRILRNLKLEHWRTIKLVNSRSRYWRIAKVLETVLTDERIAKLGYTSMFHYYLVVCEN
ncbi:hypothetical protein B5F18_11290 [Lachnoclostridium sp. An181]|nr:hypothetical protein B5F18_11290 [Lachnoclostridium sp. An181]